MVWESLSTRIDDLFLVICGSILRRTESGSVTVWIVLGESRTVSLWVYNAFIGKVQI